MSSQCSNGTSLSLLKDMVSKQPGPKLNKQPQQYESLPDGLTLPTSTFLHKYFLSRGLFSCPNWKKNNPSNITCLENAQNETHYQQVSANCYTVKQKELLRNQRPGTMQSQKVEFLEPPNLCRQIYLDYFYQ